MRKLLEVTSPLPSREREGPIAKQWEGEGAVEASLSRHIGDSPLTLTLSRKGRGKMM